MTPNKTSIYLDHAATTPLDPEVLVAMMPYMDGSLSFGNASSIHSFGRYARAAMDTAREQAADLIKADFSEIYFTSGGTESDNLAVIGAMNAAPAHKNHLIVSAIEHHAVLHAAHFLESQGYEVTILQSDSTGLISPEALQSEIKPTTALVSIMHANNEIGTIQPVEELLTVCRQNGVLFHTDAVQTVGQIPVQITSLPVDLLTFSSHKIYGPKGIGVLYIRQGTKISPQAFGGTQEREKRPGTENIPAIVGFGRAAELTAARRECDNISIGNMRQFLKTKLSELVPDIHFNGNQEHCLSSILNVSVNGVEGATLLMNLDRMGVAASSGSACSSGSIEPSHVLKAIGLNRDLASSGVRFSLGRKTTVEECGEAAQIFAEIVSRIRQ